MFKRNFGQTSQGKVEEYHLFNKSEWIAVPERGEEKISFGINLHFILAFVTGHIVASPHAVLSFSSIEYCSKSLVCDRNKGHPGHCNKNRALPQQFWRDSPFFQLKEGQGKLSRKSREVDNTRTEVKVSEENIAKKREQLDSYEKTVQERVDAASKHYKILLSVCFFVVPTNTNTC